MIVIKKTPFVTLPAAQAISDDTVPRTAVEESVSKEGLAKSFKAKDAFGVEKLRRLLGTLGVTYPKNPNHTQSQTRKPNQEP
ncbi:hypothetical protein FNV43_RR17876 [Rhamnella rubrinervis]|uniref:Uncharacterized protein n=1 Tax=Rhamnella rubrinervis TaxID=2594499 RepID=A0A8K0E2L1_9ROSA|nr:hypothetical protein FNV43_RR17876 [Rhamnella rubrinervis]